MYWVTKVTHRVTCCHWPHLIPHQPPQTPPTARVLRKKGTERGAPRTRCAANGQVTQKQSDCHQSLPSPFRRILAAAGGQNDQGLVQNEYGSLLQTLIGKGPNGMETAGSSQGGAYCFQGADLGRVQAPKPPLPHPKIDPPTPPRSQPYAPTVRVGMLTAVSMLRG